MREIQALFDLHPASFESLYTVRQRLLLPKF